MKMKKDERKKNNFQAGSNNFFVKNAFVAIKIF